MKNKLEKYYIVGFNDYNNDDYNNDDYNFFFDTPGLPCCTSSTADTYI